jgi:hypothetical protein
MITISSIHAPDLKQLAALLKQQWTKIKEPGSTAYINQARNPIS